MHAAAKFEVISDINRQAERERGSSSSVVQYSDIIRIMHISMYIYLSPVEKTACCPRITIFSFLEYVQSASKE